MDPEATLKEMRALASNILHTPDAVDLDIYVWATRLADQVEAMDGWLSKGGFMPKDWRN